MNKKKHCFVYHISAGSDFVDAGSGSDSVLDAIEENADLPGSPAESITSQELPDFDKEIEECDQ